MHPVLDDADADGYLTELVRRAGAILRDGLIGAWLVNSGARDDYLPGRSDLDVTVAVAEPLDEETKLGLARSLLHRSLPCPAPRLELVVYRRAVLAAPGPRPAFELNLNTGRTIDDHVGTDPSREPSHWFVLDLAAARERSAVLLGPPLADLLGPIPDADVVAALRASSAWHGVHDTEAPNRVLNACRAWRWLETRRWSSKREAAAWAIAAGGDGALIRLALARRRGETDDALPAERVTRLAAAVDERLAGEAA
jgi:hypothetical protein